MVYLYARALFILWPMIVTSLGGIYDAIIGTEGLGLEYELVIVKGMGGYDGE